MAEEGKKPGSDDEFSVDEPDEDVGSESEPEGSWDGGDDENSKKKSKGKKNKGTKRSSKGGGNQSKRSKADDDDDEDIDEEEIEDEEEDEEEESESSAGEDEGKDPTKKEFKSGKFVILKKDLSSPDNPPIWKIDGKVLLQKFMPFEKDGKVLYKSTSTYSGWSHHNRDQYSPAPVRLEDEGPNETIVEFLRSQIELDHNDVAATITSGAAY